MSDFTDVKIPESAEQPGRDDPPVARSRPSPRAQRGGVSLVVVAAVAIAFVVGVAAGGVPMWVLNGYHFGPPAAAASPSGDAPGPGRANMPPGPPIPVGIGGMGGGGGQRNNPSKGQLTNLIAKLDVLTEKPLSVQLTADQRKQIQEQLKGLADAKELSDKDAEDKLNKLTELLKDQKDTLEAAGFRWPGERGGFGRGMGAPLPNPFTAEADAQHLKALSERLEKSGNP